MSEPKWDETEEIAPSWDETSEVESTDKQAELEKKYSKSKSAAMGAKQGLTFNLADEIGAGMQVGMDKGQALLNYFGLADKSPSQVAEDLKKQGFTGDIGPTTAGEVFDKALAEERQAYEEAKQANPKSFMAGNIGGGIAPALLTGGGSLGMQALKGAAQGAVAGFGGSEDKFSKQGLKETLMGAGIGGVAPAVGKGLSTGVSKIAGKTADMSKSLANSQAVRSLGFGKKLLQEIEGKGAMDDLGDLVLREKLITPFAGAKSKDLAVKQLLSKSGKTIGDSFDELNAAGGAIDTRKLQKAALEKLGQKYNPTGELVGTPGDKALEEAMEQFGGKPIISLKGAHAAQQQIDDQIYSKATGGLKSGAEASRTVRQSLNKEIMDEAKQAADVMGKSDVFDNLQKANKDFSLGKMAEKLTSGKLASENSNKMFSLTDTITGVGALGAAPMTGGMSLAVPLAKKYGEKYGNQQLALTANKFSQGMNAFKQSVENGVLSQSRFGGVLRDAAARGEPALNATHFLLMKQDPEYRELYNQEKQKGEQGE